MCPKEATVRTRFARRDFLGAGAALVGVAAAGPLLAQQPPATAAARVKGPAVWLDMDQAELDAAYDQIKYAPNLPQIVKRYATNSEAVRARLGAPRRYAYGPSPIEALDVYATKRANAPMNIFIHGGAWRGGLAKDFGYPAELFVHAGAHHVVPDFINVTEANGSLMPMAEQVRRAVAWVYRNARSFGGDQWKARRVLETGLLQTPFHHERAHIYGRGSTSTDGAQWTLGPMGLAELSAAVLTARWTATS